MIRSHRSFLVINLSDSLSSLIKNEGMSKSLGVFFKHTQNVSKNITVLKHHSSEIGAITIDRK